MEKKITNISLTIKERTYPNNDRITIWSNNFKTPHTSVFFLVITWDKKNKVIITLDRDGDAYEQTCDELIESLSSLFSYIEKDRAFEIELEEGTITKEIFFGVFKDMIVETLKDFINEHKNLIMEEGSKIVKI